MDIDIEKMFQDEVREKKRTASGIYSRTGKRGYVGRVNLPSELLRGKEKKLYQGTGKVRSFNMYDTIITYGEFTNLPVDEQKKYLVEYRERHANALIMKTWGINHNVYYKLVSELGIQKAYRRNNRKGVANVANVTKEVSTEVAVTPKQEEKENGMTLSLKGTYSADEIIRKLEKFGLILSDEPKEFKIELQIIEKK